MASVGSGAGAPTQTPNIGFSAAERIIGAINSDTDDERRVITAVGFMSLAKDGRAAFPNLRPAANQEVIDLAILLGTLKRESVTSSFYIFVGGETDQTRIASLSLDSRGYLSG